MIVPIPYVLAGIGVATIALSIPLILRKVPMNRLYGVRLRCSFVSQRNWYAINAYGGKLLLAFGAFLLLFAALTRASAPPPDSPWAVAYLIAPLLALIPVLLLIKRFARSLPDPTP